MNRFLGRLAVPLILAALGLAGVAATIFLGIAEEVIEGDSQAIDHWILQRLRPPRRSHGRLRHCLAYHRQP